MSNLEGIVSCLTNGVESGACESNLDQGFTIMSLEPICGDNFVKVAIESDKVGVGVVTSVIVEAQANICDTQDVYIAITDW